MAPEKVLAERRPSEIIWAYFEEVTVIEENAIRLETEYFEVAA